METMPSVRALVEAVEQYTEALERGFPERHIIYSNLSAAHLKQGDATLALANANCCIDAKVTFGKAIAG